ncbi:polymorphic toxin-type HINT domain-containing protein [Peribacillus frigoritolerans]|uniref:polymorphic toxin-type HINT domain-containing protein n=1 Tax=Peribacillus frigoritolerans TaxID=450367 RepID=UPI0020794053|nr:polymorphic toxin-type HINT domain-containing protein [Peribacillus frigoritolerans]USK62607.1 HINT domain-containing protein [Peribacillus frigoritolerans]
MDVIYEIHIGNEIIETTDEHPFWIVGEGWVEAKNLVAGDLLETNIGNTIRIDTIEIVQKQETVYNFKVKDYHSYYVSDLRVWTHNSCKKPKSSNHLKADSNATGAHSVFKKNKKGTITKYETYKQQTNLRNPNPWVKVKRYDGNGPTHFDKKRNKAIDTPHVHMFNRKGNEYSVRSARPKEKPKQRR